jgi:hypothetical protein
MADTGSQVVVDVWNRALDRIGQSRPIASEDETTLAAAVCKRHYPDCLDEALELRDWPFARGQAALALLAEVSRVGWVYAYALPSDFVAARGLIVGGQRLSLQGEEDREPHEIQSDDAGEGQLLLCDLELEDSDALVYTRRHETVSRWPRQFLSAVAWRLASELALAIVKGVEGQKLAQACLIAFDTSIRVAFANQANQGQRDPDPDPPSIRARG